MRFFTTGTPPHEDIAESVKEHVEVIYPYIKNYLDDNDPYFTIPDENNDHVYCEINRNIIWGTSTRDNYFKIYTNLIIKDEDDLKDKIFPLKLYDHTGHDYDQETMKKLFEVNIKKLFEQYSIPVSYNFNEPIDQYQQKYNAKEI